MAVPTINGYDARVILAVVEQRATPLPEYQTEIDMIIEACFGGSFEHAYYEMGKALRELRSALLETVPNFDGWSLEDVVEHVLRRCGLTSNDP